MITKKLIIGAVMIFAVSGCVNQSHVQLTQSNTKRLELLIEKERKDNDELNLRKSVMESQIANLNEQCLKTATLKNEEIKSLNEEIEKLNTENKKLKNQFNIQTISIQQQKVNEEKTIEALSEKINDLAEDKKELITEKYNNRNHHYKKWRRR